MDAETRGVKKNGALVLPALVPWMAFAFILLIFGVRNLPLNLDEYDQAKQGYTSYEMVEQGNWWFQSLPKGGPATKPPLMGWISAGFKLAVPDVGWLFVLILPSFMSAVALLYYLKEKGEELWSGGWGALLAMGIFGLNMLSIRIATLVRTDMLLALFIFAGGALIWEKLRNKSKWDWSATTILGFFILLAMFTKGPVLYAFLLPGLLAFPIAAILLKPEGLAKWDAWQPLLHFVIASVIPFALFAWWSWAFTQHDPEFAEAVLGRELAGRFTTGEEAVHNNQPVYYYFVHLLHKLAPWSLIFFVLLHFKSARLYLRDNPAALWLICWVAGAFIVMSLVPSKRVDRIYPVVLPLTLLITSLAGQVRFTWKPAGRAVVAAFILAALAYGGYTAQQLHKQFSMPADWLVKFGRDARRTAEAEELRLGVIRAEDEGLVIYAKVPDFILLDRARENWERGELDLLLIDEEKLSDARHEFSWREGQTFEVIREKESPRSAKNDYFLIRRLPQ